MAVIGCAIPMASAGPLADYGDAPDNTTGQVFAYPGVEGQFPTLYATANSRMLGRTGAHHLTTSEEWLNETSLVSTATKETDALITDLDFDDSNAEVIYDDSVGPPYKAFAIIPVHVASGAPDTTRYLNVLIDQNRDGYWENGASVTPEWLVVNKAINVPPGKTLITLPDFLLDTTESFWMRVTLTRSPIDESLFSSVGGWDGSAPSGGFAYGETEDYLIAAPSVNFSVYNGNDSKCIIKLRYWGPKDGKCDICGAKTKKVQRGLWTNFYVKFDVVRAGAAPPDPLRVTVGPAWAVHGQGGHIEIDSLPANPVVANPAGCILAGGQSLDPVEFPSTELVWQDFMVPEEICEKPCTFFVRFRAMFPGPNDGGHWCAELNRLMYDPPPYPPDIPPYPPYIDVESDSIIADFEEAPIIEFPTLTPIGIIALMGLLSVVAVSRIKRR